MARFEIAEADGGSLADKADSAEALYDLGMRYSVGLSVPVDFVSAHKWFNLAAMRGHEDAIRLRREMATQMSDAEIGLAQRAARDWLKTHPSAPAEKPAVRVAA